ncbi:MAG: ComF family protein [Dehalococcoidia bacterium]|nr:ComF family protein [Dehalococcoidia bacterium]
MLHAMSTTALARRGSDIATRLRAGLLDVLLPQQCIVCGDFGASLHPECLTAFPPAEGSRCARCWRPVPTTWCERCASEGPDVPAFDALRTPFRFEDHARRAILEAKFRGITSHLPVLAGAAVEVIPPEWRYDAVVAVPLARVRERRRGYNQAAILARHIARATGVREHGRLIARVRSTPAQATLSAERRATNLVGAFAVRGVPPPAVLVVDDVTTTGSTLDAVASALKAAGAERVYVLAVARED